jgi:hypothetical protein
MTQMEQPKNESVENKQAEQTEAARQESDVAAHTQGMRSGEGDGGENTPDVDLSQASIPEWRTGEVNPPEDDGEESGDAVEIDLSKERIEPPPTTGAVESNTDSSNKSFASTQDVDRPPNKLDAASKEIKEQFPQAAEKPETPPTDTKSGGEDDDAPKPDPPKFTL